MYSCAVAGCKSKSYNPPDGEIHRFHNFPKNREQCKKWVAFCRRKDKFNARCAFICCLHFTKDSYTNSLQYEMGFATRQVLKPGVVPTVRPEDLTKEKSERSERLAKRRTKEIVNSMLEEAYRKDAEMEAETALRETEIDMSDLIDAERNESGEDYSCSENDAIVMEFRKDDEEEEEQEIISLDVDDVLLVSLDKKITGLEEKNFSLKTSLGFVEDENLTLKQDYEEMRKQVESLKTQLLKSEYKRNGLESNLKKIFTNGQIKKLLDPSKRMCWKEGDIKQSLELYRQSPKAYKFLKAKDFPFPSVRTLQHWGKERNMKDLENEINECDDIKVD